MPRFWKNATLCAGGKPRRILACALICWRAVITRRRIVARCSAFAALPACIGADLALAMVLSLKAMPAPYLRRASRTASQRSAAP